MIRSVITDKDTACVSTQPYILIKNSKLVWCMRSFIFLNRNTVTLFKAQTYQYMLRELSNKDFIVLNRNKIIKCNLVIVAFFRID